MSYGNCGWSAVNKGQNMPGFIHLHCHSEYSLLDGLSKISRDHSPVNLVTTAKNMDMRSVALTDHGVIYGAIEFYKECKKEKIKPLIGMEGYMVTGDLRNKESRADKENYHLVLIAKNHTGYRNLMKLSTIAHLEGFYYRPRFDKNTLALHSEGLICLSACPKGEIAQIIVSGGVEKAVPAVQWYQEVFGDDYYLEIQRHQFSDYVGSASDSKIKDQLTRMQQTEDAWVKGIISLSRRLGIKLVATNDSHYLQQMDAVAQDVLVCVSTGKNVSDIERMRYVDTPTFHLRSGAEMADIFTDVPDALENTLQVADKVDLAIELGQWHFPNIDLPENVSAPDHLRRLSLSRLQEKIPGASEELNRRLEFELEVIITKGYAPYFLMMADMVNWCTELGIITNTRGSAAGSLVSYVLGITTVDPVKYGLPFERFLNPYRPKPPDIDLDIADDRREELIANIVEKYGADKVAQICTFGRMLARAAVRDVGRVLGHPYSFPDKIAKLVPMGSQGFPMTLEHALEISPELKILYDSDPAARQLIDLARQIEGNARHSSVHAAGLVVSPTAMTDYTPLQLEPNGSKLITQYEMHACEDVGLVKFDILGIRNLSILGAARDIVEKTRATRIDLGYLPLDDKKTFSMLSRGETMGVFQLGGSGMTKWLRELKPTRIEDIMVMIALFRPGPMANIPEYIARKNRRSPVTYMHPKMEKFLDKSFGILVYQEDVLFTALEMAGYDWGSVDALRGAIGKKKPKEMAQQHEIFVAGCVKHSGMTAAEAEKLWELFVPFQGYGFNKAHAASYGLVSYQSAYLKAHYPVEYMTALLSAESGNTEKVVEAIEECRRMKIKVLPPDINSSDFGFTIELHVKSLDGRAIRFGLSAIKNVGDIAIKLILEARAKGQFLSLTDFILRVDSQKVNRKVLESLIKAGGLDSFGKRSAMLAALDKIREMGTTLSKLKSMGQGSLFGSDEKSDPSDNFPDIPEFEKQQKLTLEKELLGFYLTEHPHAEKLDLLKSKISVSISNLYLEAHSGQSVITGGIIESCRNVVTRTSNQQMCFARITDLGRYVEVVVFPKIFAATSDVWQTDTVVLVSGRLEVRGSSESDDENPDTSRDLSLVVESAVAFTGPDTALPQTNNGNGNSINTSVVTIEIPSSFPSARLVALNQLLQENKGDKPVQLVFYRNGSSKILPLPYGLDWSEQLKNKIDALLKNPS